MMGYGTESDTPRYLHPGRPGRAPLPCPLPQALGEGEARCREPGQGGGQAQGQREEPRPHLEAASRHGPTGPALHLGGGHPRPPDPALGPPGLLGRWQGAPPPCPHWQPQLAQRVALGPGGLEDPRPGEKGLQIGLAARGRSPFLTTSCSMHPRPATPGRAPLRPLSPRGPRRGGRVVK